MFIKYSLKGKEVPNRSLKLFVCYSSGDGNGGIQETSNCLFPFKWRNLLKDFNNVKKTLSLREVLKQRLCFHHLVKLAKSTQYWNTTTGLQLKPKGVAQRYRTKVFFLYFWKSLGCEEEKDILSSKLLLFFFFFSIERTRENIQSVCLFLIRKENMKAVLMTQPEGHGFVIAWICFAES